MGVKLCLHCDECQVSFGFLHATRSTVLAPLLAEFMSVPVEYVVAGFSPRSGSQNVTSAPARSLSPAGETSS